MRPLRLIMSAFGPYAGRTEIDMRPLGEKGLYVVTGDTGSGKTTIFDAITYALYGEPSGDVRESDMLRSQYAAPETPTYVEMEFLYRGEVYTVRRSPEYERPKARGTGTTRTAAEASLLFPDGRVLTKTREVSRAVTELLGLDRRQFSQIAMIAQGDFQKLLLAKTEDRSRIFRDLFGTGRYQLLQERLRTEAAALKNKLDGLRDSLRRGEEALGMPAQLSEQEQEAWIHERLAEEEIREKTLSDASLELERTLGEVHQRIGRARAEEASRRELKEAEEWLTEHEAELTRLQTLHEEEEAREPERRSLREQLSAKKERLPLYEEREVLLLTEQNESKETERITEENRKAVSYAESLSERLTGARKELEELGAVEAESVRIKAEEEALGERDTKNGQLKNRYEEYQGLLKGLSAHQQSYQKAVQKAEEEKEYSDRVRRLFLDAQAGVLAARLVEGEKCPVCGSLHHPEKAMPVEGAPDKEAVEAASRAAEKASQRAQALSQNCAQWIGRRDAAARQIEESSGCGIEEVPAMVQKETLAIQAERERLTERKKSLDTQAARRKQLQEAIPKAETRIQESKDRAVQLQLKRAELEARAKSRAERLKVLNETLDEKSADEARLAIDSMARRLEAMEKALTLSRAEHEKMERQSAAKREVLRSLTEQLKNSEPVNLAALEERRAALQERNAEVEKALRAALQQKGLYQQALSRRRETGAQLAETEKQYVLMRSLSNTAGGNVAGKDKVMLETYVQTLYLDRILRRANLRLMSMSGGQYEMIRRDSAENQRSQSGLELDVIDHYNGTRRSVKTLSGGEAFKASLSLALGLSDEIQSNAGGIQLDTMFIDEGFGSLDAESLDQALTTLQSLTEGNRLIGIISHVTELKSRIERQIQVHKEASGGSYARVCV